MNQAFPVPLDLPMPLRHKAPKLTRDLEKFGHAVAFVWPDGSSLTYAELVGEADKFASLLPEVKSLVALEAAPCREFVAAYMGTLRAGHAVALLPPDDEALRTFFLDRFRPDLVYRPIAGRWTTEMHDSNPDDGAPHPDLCLVLRTSGSTGEARAVRLSARAVEANARAIAQYLELTAADRAALVLPLHYCYGLSVLHSHLAVGASVLVPGCSAMDPSFAQRLRDGRGTNLAGVPYTFELLDRSGFEPSTLPDLRFLTVAGGRLTPERVLAWNQRLSASGKRLFVMYGQTEATARMAYLPPEEAVHRPDSIGRPVPGGTLTVVDTSGNEITAAEVAGELLYRGPNVMMGYAEGREDLGRGAEVGRLSTGDLAVRDSEGFFRIVGRLRRMSKIAGVRLHHDGLETALEREGIAAAVVGDDTLLRVFFTSDHRADAVRERLAELARLPLQYVRAEHLKELPRLPSGKIDYADLRARPEEVSAGPGSVLEAFEQTFYPRQVRLDQTFADLGGDSLRHVELSMALEGCLGSAPPGWERRTIAQLSALRPTRQKGVVIGTDLIIRTIAILLVVVQHQMLWPIPGGAAAMVVLIGFNLARFQSGALVSGDFRRFFRPLPSVLVPYFLIVAAYALAWGKIPWASVMLLGNFGFADPVHGNMVPYLYWFVEAFVQMWLLLALVFLFRPVRRFAAGNPFRFGLAFLATAVALRFTIPPLWGLGGRQIFTLPWILYLCALGWCAAFADTRQRRATVLVAAAPLLAAVAYWGGNWIGAWVKYGLQLAVVAALLYLPQLNVPRQLARLVLPVAAASFHIYLFHRFVPELLLARTAEHLSPAAFDLLSIAGGVALGWGVFKLQSLVRPLLSRQPRLELRVPRP